jgi:predicted RNase H-like nuclease (RuvC/YqgF family)
MAARGPVGYTCPKIDHCIDTIKAVISGESGWSPLDDLIGRHGELEEIRSANDALRDWGTENEDRVKELEATVARLESENESLRGELKAAHAELGEFA